MTRDEYLSMLETEPATPNQRGAIMRECDRLGVADRAERLAILAALLDLAALGSTAELTMGQAGKLVNLLQHTSDRSELPDITTAADDGDQLDGQAVAAADGDLISVADAINRIMLMVALALYGKTLPPDRAIWPRISGDPARERPFPAQGRANSADQSSAPPERARPST